MNRFSYDVVLMRSAASKRKITNNSAKRFCINVSEGMTPSCSREMINARYIKPILKVF